MDSHTFWFNLDDNSYAKFCSDNTTPAEKWDIVNSCCGIREYYSPSKVRIVVELFYQAVIFCADSGLNFQCVSLLIRLIGCELYHLSNRDSIALLFDKENSTSYQLERLINNVSKSSYVVKLLSQLLYY